MSQASEKMLRQLLPIAKARKPGTTMKRLRAWWRSLDAKEKASWTRRWHAGRDRLRLEDLNDPKGREVRLHAEAQRGVIPPQKEE